MLVIYSLGNLEICHSRLPENAFASIRGDENVLKSSSTTAELFDTSHDVVLKLHENRKQT